VLLFTHFIQYIMKIVNFHIYSEFLLIIIIFDLFM